MMVFFQNRHLHRHNQEIKKLLQPFEPLNNKYSSRETPGQTYYNQSEIQREIQKTKCKLPLSPLNFSL